MRVTLKAARINAKLTQEDAADQLHITRSTLSNWEAGKTYPNARQIQELVSLYGVTYDELIFSPTITL